MRVLLAPIDIAGQMRITALELEKRGYYARFFDGHASYLGYEHEEGQRFALKELPDLDGFNIFDVFFGAFKPIGGRNNLPKKLKLLYHFCGSDVRQLDVAREHNKFAVVKGKDDSMAIRTHLKELSVLGDTCTIMDEELRPQVKPFFSKIHILPRMLEIGRYNPVYNGHKKLTVVHASTHGAVKGTPQIVEAVKELKKSYDFDFWLVAGMRHDKAMELYNRADIIIAQLNLDSYGVFAIEGMAMGKVVITRLSEEMRATYPESPPVISADPEDIEMVLASTLNTCAEDRYKIGQEGRAYVEKYHTPEAVMPKLLEIYKSL